jgi:hypothetical protein
MTTDHIEIPDEFLDVAGRWYSGQSDLLYAVSSSGGLTRGTIRPYGCATDAQWYLQLWRELSCDVGAAHGAASDTPIQVDDVDDFDDTDTLARFETWIDDTIIPRLEAEYDLAEWEPASRW